MGLTSSRLCAFADRMKRSAGLAFLAFVVLAWPLGAAGGDREDQARAQRVSAELKAVLALKVRSASEIQELVRDEKYEEFEGLSKQYEEKFKTDPKYESPLVKLYAALDGPDDFLFARKLDKWVAKRPSYISHGARGVYREIRGYRVRGGEFAKNTPQARFERMKEFHRQAVPDLLAALKDNPRFSPAYVSLIAINRAAGDTRGAEKVLDEAVRWIPETYYIRHAYLTALNPRWGGDYSMMQAYANSLEQEVQLNPRIWSLRAEVPAELGRNAWRSKDYPEAIKYYTEALRFGDRLEFLRSRGTIFWTMKQRGAARQDFARYLEYDKSDEALNRWFKSQDAVK